MKRTVQIAYDSDGNVEYWGVEIATGDYLINRYYYGSDGVIKIEKEKQGTWANRENLNWG